MDKYSPHIRKKMMKAVKSKGSKIESKCAKEFRARGLFFRRNVKSLAGKPDFALKKYKVVVFADSCFWHGCPEHCRKPHSNTEFWNSKIQRNKDRDKEVTEFYVQEGWRIFRIWEHEILDPVKFTKRVDEVQRAVNKRKNCLSENCT